MMDNTNKHRYFFTHIRLFLMFISVPILHRVLPLPKLMRLLDSPPRDRVFETLSVTQAIQMIDRIVRITRGFLFPGNCVRKSILLFHLLRKNGYPAMIHFGISSKNEQLFGHCWVDLDGSVLTDVSDPRQSFQTIYSYP